jgi:phosphoglycerate dehydrogenase-like enzyme
VRIAVATTLDPQDLDRIRSACPDDEIIETSADNLAGVLPGVEVLFTSRLKPDSLQVADNLRWVQARSAGINGYPLEALAQRGIALTSASGAHGIPIAENILAMMLAFATRLHLLRDLQNRREWDRSKLEEHKFELHGQTLLIAGLGGLGSELARKAHALGMHVIGVRHRDLPPPEGVDELVLTKDLMTALPKADHVALCLPLTPGTTGFLSKTHFRTMKPTAYVYNAGRGQSIDQRALIAALKNGQIAGAGLDVTDPEPIPEDDPIWSFPNVILTQHTSGTSPQNSRRVTDIFLENLRKYRAGEKLKNLYDAERRY